MIRFADHVLDEIDEAADWYEDRQDGLGRKFRLEVYTILASVDRKLAAFPRLETLPKNVTDREIRRVLLHQFPYIIVYEIVPDETLVLAEHHEHRRPNYWMERE